MLYLSESERNLYARCSALYHQAGANPTYTPTVIRYLKLARKSGFLRQGLMLACGWMIGNLERGTYGEIQCG